MAIHRIKHSFSSGEVSPLMAARLDFSRYTNGCKRLINMVCTTQGPATRRSGTRFIFDLNSIGLDPANPLIRHIPFIFNEIQAYVMVFFMHTDGQARVVFGTDNGLLIYTDPLAEFCPPVPIETYLFDDPDPLYINYYLDSGADIKVIHVAGNGTETALIENTDYTLTVNANPPSVIDINPRAGDGHYDVYMLLDPAINIGDVVELILPVGWDIENFDWAQSADEMYLAQSGLAPHIIRRYSPECWELSKPGFVEQPAEWSDDFGWPERVTFHQQRLAFAANILKRQTVWLSRAGDFSSFDSSTGTSGTIDSDAVTFTLDSGTQNKIIWMLSAKGLNIGTIGNEWTVVGATRTALTPSNILAQRQTNHGGEQNKPLMVGITTLFMERHGRAINEFVYDFNVDSYKTSDMSVLASHLTEQYSIVDWSYQQTPDNIIWSVRSDGALLGITYQRQHQVIGWHDHNTKGEFKAITVIPGNNREDEVWITCKRVIEGNDLYYLEKMAEQFKSDDTEDGEFLDSYSHYEGAPASVISGLDYLEGETVSVLANGTAHPDAVVSGGSITLNNTYTHVLVGLNYISEIWPNLPEIGQRDGTVLGRMQRITNLDIDFYRTLGIYIGRWDPEDGESEEEHPFRVPGDLTGQAVPLFTGIKHISYPEGYNRETTYFIRQKQPLPLTVRAVVDTIEVNE